MVVQEEDSQGVRSLLAREKGTEGRRAQLPHLFLSLHLRPALQGCAFVSTDWATDIKERKDRHH